MARILACRHINHTQSDSYLANWLLCTKLSLEQPKQYISTLRGFICLLSFITISEQTYLQRGS